MKVTVAHFSSWKIARAIVILGIFLGCVLGYMLLSYHGHFVAYVKSRGGIWFPMLVISSVGIAYYLIFEMLLIWQVLFDQRRALWVTSGRVVYLHKLYLSEKCEDIAAITAGTYGLRRFSSIVLEMRDGSQKIIP